MQSNQMIIAIGRQFGSGGRVIGQAIAQKLGVPYYDRQLICEAISELGYLPELYNGQDEKKPSLFRSFMSFNLGAYFVDSSSCSRSERLYQAQAEAIRRIASKGGCVIIGRTADYILRDCPEMVSIFLSGSLQFRVDRVMASTPGLSRRVAHNMIIRNDRQRREFYEFFTGRVWGDASNYHLSLDTSTVGIDNSIEIITNYIEIRSKLLRNR